MQALDPIIIAIGVILTGVISSWITSILKDRRYTGVYNRGWMAGKEFAAREFHDRITR